MKQIDYNKDGNQKEPECNTCPHWKYGPEKGESMGQSWNQEMCCWHGAYRPSFWTGLRVTHPHNQQGGAPNWCPRRLKNSQCTCGKCPECTFIKRERK